MSVRHEPEFRLFGVPIGARAGPKVEAVRQSGGQLFRSHLHVAVFQGFPGIRPGRVGSRARQMEDIQSKLWKIFRQRICTSNTVKSIFFTDGKLFFIDINEEIHGLLQRLRGITQQPQGPDFTALLRQEELRAVRVRLWTIRRYSAFRALCYRRVRCGNDGRFCPQRENTAQGQYQGHTGRGGQAVPSPAMLTLPLTAGHQLRVRSADGEKQPFLILHSKPSFSK